MGKIAVVLVWILILTYVVRFNDFFGVAIVNEQVMKLLFLGSGGLLLLWRASLAWQLFRAINPFILMFVALGVRVQLCLVDRAEADLSAYADPVRLCADHCVVRALRLDTPAFPDGVMRGVLLAIPLLSYAGLGSPSRTS